MTINVVGATGQLGGKVMAALLAQGAASSDLIASVRTPAKAQALQAQGIMVRHADYDDGDTLRAAFEGTDVLLLIPSTAPVEPRILQHARAVEAAQAAGVQRLLFSSFAAASPTSAFAVAPFMLYAEAKTRQSGLGWTILRNGMYLDPIADWTPELVAMGRLPYPVARGRVAYISRDDLARATAAACLDDAHSGCVYDLTGGEAVSMPELAAAIAAATGAPVVFDHVSDDAFRAVCRADGESDHITEILLTMYRAVEQGEFEQVTDHVEHLTGQPPQTVRAYLNAALAT